MTLVDANLLVYAHVQDFAQHERARTWLDERLNGTARVGLAWPSLLAFLRLVTNPRVFERPTSMRSAWQQVEEWLDCDAAWVPAPTDRHRHVLGRLLGEAAVRANLVPDAHLAALAIEHGLVLASADGDFARFPGLRFENPLAGPVEA
ncbi:MAG TPA: TA system VapC family ribonuclease toxin [Myxococcota bacterium]|nr:TA system VapC family ribonuclease toxin [Myxococcota bacterium]